MLHDLAPWETSLSFSSIKSSSSAGRKRVPCADGVLLLDSVGCLVSPRFSSCVGNLVGVCPFAGATPSRTGFDAATRSFSQPDGKGPHHRQLVKHQYILPGQIPQPFGQSRTGLYNRRLIRAEMLHIFEVLC